MNRDDFAHHFGLCKEARGWCCAPPAGTQRVRVGISLLHYVNPGSEILSAEMMLRHMGWTEAADLIIGSMEKSILSKKVTYDFARLMDGATQVSAPASVR